MRPLKSGLDYFPLDTDMDQDDKIFMLEAELGELAFGRFIKLLTEIYRNGYYKEWTEDDALVFAGKKRISYQDLQQLVKAAVKRGLFNQELYDQYQILTSAGIQKRYLNAASKRSSIQIDSRFKLYDDEDIPPGTLTKVVYTNSQETSGESRGEEEEGRGENEGLQGEKESNQGETEEEIPQSKAKQSKAQQSKAKGTVVDNSPPRASPGEVSAAAAAAVNLQLRREEAQAVAENLAAQGLGVDFIAWAGDEAKRRSDVKSPPGFTKRLLCSLSEYADWIREYRQAASRESPARPKWPAPVCPECGGALRDISGEVWCPACRVLVWRWDGERYVELRERAQQIG